MYFELKENRPHGTPEHPFSLYLILKMCLMHFRFRYIGMMNLKSFM